MGKLCRFRFPPATPLSRKLKNRMLQMRVPIGFDESWQKQGPDFGRENCRDFPRPSGARKGPVRRSAAKRDGKVRGPQSQTAVYSFGSKVVRMVSMWQPQWHSRFESGLRNLNPLTLPSFAWVPPSPRWGEVKWCRVVSNHFPRTLVHRGEGNNG